MSSSLTSSTSFKVPFASSESSGATITSLGRIKSTWFSIALAIISLARSNLSSSTRDLPTSRPLDFKKVFAMAPTITRVSTFSNRFSITPILSETFEPPRIAAKGFSGFLRASSKYLISFSTKRPAQEGKNSVTPTFEAWALWAVPKASFTKISPRLASFFAKSGSFFSSPLTNLKFSRRASSPPLRSLTSSITFSSTTSFDGINLRSFFKSSDALLATGARENSSLYSPLGLPKWLMRTTFAPFSSKYSIVGIAFTILSSPVTLPSFIGTLKSTLTRAVLSLKSKSLIVFFTLHLLFFDLYLKFNT